MVYTCTKPIKVLEARVSASKAGDKQMQFSSSTSSTASYADEFNNSPSNYAFDEENTETSNATVNENSNPFSIIKNHIETPSDTGHATKPRAIAHAFKNESPIPRSKRETFINTHRRRCDIIDTLSSSRMPLTSRVKHPNSLHTQRTQRRTNIKTHFVQPTITPLASPLAGLSERFVERVMDQLESSSRQSRECLLARTISLVRLQKSFAAAGKPTQVTVAFHYYNARNNNKNNLKDRPFYLALHPYVARSSEFTGVMVAVLKGVTKRIGRKGINDTEGFDTVICNSALKDDGLDSSELIPRFHDHIIPKRSSQWLPLYFFPVKHTTTANDSIMTERFAIIMSRKMKVITSLLDEFFNDGKPTKIEVPILEHKLPTVATRV